MKKLISPRRIQIAGLAGLVLASGLRVSTSVGADVAPATQPVGTASVESLNADIDRQYGILQDVLANPDAFTDAGKRKDAAAKAVPCFKQLVSDCNQLAVIDPDNKQEALDRKAEFTSFLALFGDTDATKTISQEAESADPDIALEGKRSTLLVSWLNNAADQKTQTGIADDIEKLAKDHTASIPLTVQMLEMSRLGCSSPDLSKRLQTLATDVMKNQVAEGARQQLQAGQKLAALENKPLTITGKEPDGKTFSTADWKGKVILVDFWATWCGPCREELPRVSKLYADYHAKGLEVLGVSNDYAADDLSKFLKSKPEMPWPQLFDADAAKNQQWNPITAGFGIDGIPTMFLIDKKGVCRTVTARENMEDLIPKLLAE